MYLEVMHYNNHSLVNALTIYKQIHSVIVCKEIGASRSPGLLVHCLDILHA